MGYGKKKKKIFSRCIFIAADDHDTYILRTGEDQRKKGKNQNATWYYKSKDALVMGVKVDKLSLENDGLEINSASDYAALYIRANDIPGNPVIKTRDKYVYFEYTKTVSNTAFAYLTSVYDHGDSYWMVNFACYKDAYPESSGDFFKWADSVVFDNE